MYVTRWIILSLLILALVVGSTSQARAAIHQSWDHTRPDVVKAMDSLYAVIRDFVAGSEPNDGMDDHAPGVDFDIITTMDLKTFTGV